MIRGRLCCHRPRTPEGPAMYSSCSVSSFSFRRFRSSRIHSNLFAMRKSTRYFILFYGLLETFIFTGNIFGWNSLHQMLLEEGIYHELCDKTVVHDVYTNDSGRIRTSRSATESHKKYIDGNIQFTTSNQTTNVKYESMRSCAAQDKLLNLAFTIGTFCLGFSAFIWGFLLDRWGLRCVRLIINAFLTTGTILLCLTERETSYLIFPSLILMCLAGIPLRLANMQIADLFPKQRSTIITLYSGAFGASASVFVFIKYAYVAGLAWEWACFVLVIFSVIMFPITLFVLPAHKIEKPFKFRETLFSLRDCSSEIIGIATSSWKNYDSIHDTERKASSTSTKRIVAKTRIEAVDKNAKGSGVNQIPLLRSLCTLSYVIHQYWFSWILIYTVVFVGTLHLWSARTFEGDSKGKSYGELYGLLQVSGLFLAPIGGVFMDWQVAKAKKEPDPKLRRLRMLQSNFWPLFLTSLLAVIAQVAKFFDTSEAIVVSILFVTLSRTFLLSIGAAYLRIRFPAEHFGRLLGIMGTISAIFTLFQYPLYIWQTSSPESTLHVNIFESVCLLLACIHPLHLLITPLQINFIEKERNLEKDETSL